jgi:ABC-type nitrate/sulfonate/bicarbonate transport system permease component
MNNIWPTLWSALAIYGVTLIGLPLGVVLAISVGIVAGFFVAHNTWEEELCNCDDEDHDH